MIAAGEDPRVHRPATDHQRVRGRRERRPAGPPGRRRGGGQALDWIGLPEAQYALAQATIYIASSPKSDSVGRAYGAAMADVLEARIAPGPEPPPDGRRSPDEAARHRRRVQVPARLRRRRRRAAIPARRAGRPAGYYVPGDQGYEATIAARMEARAQARAERPRQKSRPDMPIRLDGRWFEGRDGGEEEDRRDPEEGRRQVTRLGQVRPPGSGRVSSRTRTSTTRCAAAGRRARGPGCRGAAARAATGTPGGRPPRARPQSLPPTLP